ncbi:RluA family pseudouridine synthase [Piscinibacter sp.]|uniref:RluA family pseudouridine synthase n=1 Tax=Piscinibacter sp. TaxID=1903157 RepID=UPI0039E59EEE
MILHADETLVVADKPAGLPSVPGRPAELHDCLWLRVRAQFADALVVHRLDMATSGLVLFARGIEAQRRLSRAFAQREVEKTYAAIVAGTVAADSGEIDLPLAADWPNRPRQIVDAERGKPSLTRWRVLERAAERTHLELSPLTGRSHQLRVHLAAVGHPILGDALYAPPAIAQAAGRLLLHASALRLAHPADGRSLHVVSPAPFG